MAQEQEAARAASVDALAQCLRDDPTFLALSGEAQRMEAIELLQRQGSDTSDEELVAEVLMRAVEPISSPSHDRPNEHGDGPFWREAPQAYHDMQAVAELGHGSFEIEGNWPHGAERVVLRLVTPGPVAGCLRRSLWSAPPRLAQILLCETRPRAEWHRSLNTIFPACRPLDGEPV